jgi:cytochrome c oxidase assembly protein subunit 11
MRDSRLTLKLAALAVGMFGFGFALVPVYNVFCDVTGLGGRTASAAETVTEQPDVERTVRLEFVASVDRRTPFEFRPSVGSMEVHPGRIYAATYLARNLRDGAVVTQAVPSVAPGTAAEYLKKIECFCFTEQAFGPGEARELGVTFLIDPDLPAYTDTLTLSYTLFALER